MASSLPDDLCKSRYNRPRRQTKFYGHDAKVNTLLITNMPATNGEMSQSVKSETVGKTEDMSRSAGDDQNIGKTDEVSQSLGIIPDGENRALNGSGSNSTTPEGASEADNDQTQTMHYKTDEELEQLDRALRARNIKLQRDFEAQKVKLENEIALAKLKRQQKKESKASTSSSSGRSHAPSISPPQPILTDSTQRDKPVLSPKERLTDLLDRK